MTKVKVGIIGSGNIGTDLMLKLERSSILQPSVMIGIDTHSKGMQLAKKRGLTILPNGIDQLVKNPELADILFDATSAKAHIYNAKIAKALGKKLLDLTPAAIGSMVVPSVNLHKHLDGNIINLVTCGGQATTPIVHAINRVVPVQYAEIVATISSKSAGPGTRANIDEFTETTSKALEIIGGAKKGKAIIILNPAEPPLLMRNTVHVLMEEADINPSAIVHSINRIVKEIQEYVPKYQLRGEPLIEGNRLTAFIEVEGMGDFLPKYAGNLDIITASAVKIAEELVKNAPRQPLSVNKGGVPK